ncbi:poly-gamma-glutamate hydrolase family protein [Pontibacillus salipaludis]|uniref:Uncharacterized protein n=1 Tax=Pontibacillus salipaludis TaxID=1697394 RepID=A0ABQ1PWP3_9BACI|nr:poly-gamma-glutamate hydrolase family protein [Pontibacillus salipaludis]GGD05993.1 hypothetical protein GCM10011389_11890 [Pontibacillus salipaludis]
MKSMKIMMKVAFALIFALALLPSKVVTAEGTKTTTYCEVSCWELLLNQTNSNTLVNIDLPGEEYLQATSLLVEEIAGSTHNYYSMTRELDARSDLFIQSDTSNIFELDQTPSARISIQGSSGTIPMTTLSGLDEELKYLVKKHLSRLGFTVRDGLAASEDSAVIQTSSPGLNLLITDAQWSAFFEGGDYTSSTFKNEASKSETYFQYVAAIQDAINEYNTQKSVWMWKSEPFVDKPDETIEFLANQQVDQLYMRFYPKVDVKTYQYFIENAAKHGIKVHALIGSPLWGQDAHASDALKRVDLVHAYNQKVEQNQKFIGIHFDVEPYSLPMWDDNRQQAVKEWKQSAESYVKYAKDYGFIVGSAMPFWTDNSSVNDYDADFYKEMIDMQDYVSIMSYRNTALGSNSITSLAQNEVLHAKSPKVEVGVELNPYKIDYVSFDGKSLNYTEGEIAKVRTYFMEEAQPGFKGIAIHNYTAWKNSQ